MDGVPGWLAPALGVIATALSAAVGWLARSFIQGDFLAKSTHKETVDILLHTIEKLEKRNVALEELVWPAMRLTDRAIDVADRTTHRRT